MINMTVKTNRMTQIAGASVLAAGLAVGAGNAFAQNANIPHDKVSANVLLLKSAQRENTQVESSLYYILNTKKIYCYEEKMPKEETKSATPEKLLRCYETPTREAVKYEKKEWTDALTAGLIGGGVVLLLATLPGWIDRRFGY